LTPDKPRQTIQRMNSFFARLCGLAALGAGLTSAAEPATDKHATSHPTVYLTHDDVRLAQTSIAQFAWARETAYVIEREADAWLAKPDDWFLRNVPAASACFAYGFTGCPICDASWGTWGGVRASFDQPGFVTCAKGHMLPDADHPDAGTGCIGQDKRIHYFVGSYNAWAVETLTFKAADSLAYAYTLTGDERYAAKASLILDALATIYPSCDKGSWDYPSHPPSGRLNRPWYQVARVLVHYVDQYDQVFASPALDSPSLKPGLTRRQNIEANLLQNGATYCYAQSQAGGLNNGEADYLRGALAVGACLDMPEYVRWGVDGPFGIRSMLDNNLDRDGQYFEVSTLYAAHTRGLYLTFAEPLLNCRGSAYPQGVNLYQHPKFRRFLQLLNSSLDCAGHSPRFGDSSPDTARITPPSRPFDASDYASIERLYARTEKAAEQQKLAALLDWLADGKPDRTRGERTAARSSRIASVPWLASRDTEGDYAAFEDRRWLLFHARPLPGVQQPLAEEFRQQLTGCGLFGQKGIGILRQGTGPTAQALLLRFGPSLNHGHRDDLNINFFARGYELTYDIGYALGSTHTQVGWAHQTASHNLVVVNERLQGEGEGGSGGSLHLFADLPGLKLIEASSESSYAGQGVTLYRRTLALIDNPSGGYALDLFRVKGGNQHDYLFHTLTDQAELVGVKLGAEEPGSLAGTNICWGGQQLNDGDMAGHPNQPYWNPPPGNGYGFLIKPQRGQAADGWSAQWAVDATNGVRLLMAAQPGMEVITALAPGIYPKLPKARYVIARRKGQDLESQFAAVIEPNNGNSAIRKVERLSLRPPDRPNTSEPANNPSPALKGTLSPSDGERDGVRGLASVPSPTAPILDGSRTVSLADQARDIPPVALKITRQDGTADLVYSSADTVVRRAGDFTFAGRFIHAQVKERKLLGLSLVGAKQFQGLGWRVQPERDSWEGPVSALDYESNVITTLARLPTDGSLSGQVIVFDNPHYSRTTAYRIIRVEVAAGKTRIHLDGTLLLGKGVVGAINDAHTLISLVPHEYARTVNGKAGSGFFRGKRIRTATGATAEIVNVRYGQPMSLTVQSTEGLHAGDEFHYDDVQPGDHFTILLTASLAQIAPGQYDFRGQCKAAFDSPPGQKVNIRR
jgi:hypothetical protein